MGLAANNLNQIPVSRRTLMKGVAGLSAAAVSGAYTRSAYALEDSGYYRTTTDLNLREGPSTQTAIIDVMPAGTLVEYLDKAENGFRYVAYQGTGGWASEAYLEISNGPSAPAPVVIGTATVTDYVNFRTGPSTGHPVIEVLSPGTTVEYTDTALYGFRNVRFDGQRGWVFEDYLSLDDPGTPVEYVTTAALNLREGPGAGYDVIMVLPEGSQVLDYDGVLENGFRGVDYNGTVGWVSDAYLEPAQPQHQRIRLVATANVNLRSGPSMSYDILTVVPIGETVSDYDLVIRNGYRSVDYKGTIGWVYDDYLRQT